MGDNPEMFYDDHLGKFALWEGRTPVRDLTPTGIKQCGATATAICSVTAGKKAYVTSLFLHNTNAAQQTFTLTDSGGNVYSCTLSSKESKEIVCEQPFLVLAEGAVTGIAGTGDHVELSMVYFEKSTTQIA